MIAIIDVVGSNIRSLESCLQRLQKPYFFVRHKEELTKGSHLILAGVGSAQRAMDALHSHDLATTIPSLKLPVLGICVGMQILYESSQEGGNIPTLGILPGQITAIPPAPKRSVPHSGWNQLLIHKSSMFNTFHHQYVYFVHSYRAPMSEHTLMSVDYDGEAIPALVGKDNYFGFQFHPEKSADCGQNILKTFLSL